MLIDAFILCQHSSTHTHTHTHTHWLHPTVTTHPTSMPADPDSRLQCWNTLAKLEETNRQKLQCIMLMRFDQNVGYYNTTL